MSIGKEERSCQWKDKGKLSIGKEDSMLGSEKTKES